MGILSTLTGSTAAAALLLSAASPAAARDGRWNGPKRDHHHRHDRGPSAGSVIGAIAALGILAAITSSSSKKEAERRAAEEDAASYDDRIGEPYPDEAVRYDAAPAPGRRYSAVDTCALAARSQASRNGHYAEILGVDGVVTREGGWDISGQLEQRPSYSGTERWERGFRCIFRDGRVSAVYLD